MAASVVVGMSGGVDSSVAAYLLKKQGYNVIGVTMELWQEKNSGVSSGTEDARRVASDLGIPFYVVDFKEQFKKDVVDYFTNSYLCGKTPNPCIVCNRRIKWEALLAKAQTFGADFIATGHYSKVLKHPETGRFCLALADTGTKDQTYALYNLTQHQLEHTIMPLGEYEKDDIRAMAKEIGLVVADKPDSQDICFVPDGDYAAFIGRNVESVPPEGDFVDIEGNAVGQHKGIIHYTIGQRKGLGIAFGVPTYVCGIDSKNNRVVLGGNEDLFKREVFVRDYNPMAFEVPKGKMQVMGKLRYSQRINPCVIEAIGNRIKCTFEEPQRAPSPGQAAVFYKDGYVVGGGIIETDRI